MKAPGGLQLARSRLAVSVVFLLNGAGIGLWIPHIPLLRARLGLDDRALGMALLAAGLGAVVAMPAATRMMLRVGSRTLTSIGAIAFCLVLSLPGRVAADAGAGGLGLRLFFFGVASGTLDVSMNVHASRIETAYGRPIMSSVHGLFSLGTLLGGALASILLARQIEPAVGLTIGSIILLPFAIGASIFLLPGPDPHAAKSGLTVPPRAILFLGLIGAAGMMSEGAVADWTGVYLTTVVGMPIVAAGIAFTALAFASTLGRLLVGDRAVERFGQRRVLVASAILAAAGIVVAVLVPHRLVAPAGLAVAWLGLTSFVPIVFSAAGKQPGVVPGVGLASVATVGYVGFLAAPPVVGAVSSMLGLRIAFLMLAFVCVGIALGARGKAVHLD